MTLLAKALQVRFLLVPRVLYNAEVSPNLLAHTNPIEVV